MYTYTHKTNKKEMQKYINDICVELMENAIKEYKDISPYYESHKWEKLRNCSAQVTETENYYILRSYQTIIGAIDKRTYVAVDFLRQVYKYTNTSAQHIRKFCQDYGAQEHFSYRTVKE